MDTTSFGVELRRLRVAAGLSLSEFARLVSYSKGYLSKIETGAMPPNEALARRCDARLGAGGALSGLHNEIRREPGRPARRDDDTEVWVMVAGPEGGATFMPVRRRDVLVGGAAAIVGLTGLTGTPARASSALGGTELMAAYREMFGQVRRLGQAMSPSLLLPQVIAQAQALRSLAAGTRGADRDGLVLLAARFTEYAGWMAQEAGDERAAMWWTDAAVGLANAGGDREMSIYALVRRALVALYRRDARTTVALAQLAGAEGRMPPRVLGLAAQREAQGHALAGDHDACLRALDRADELQHRDAQDRGEAPVLGPSFVAKQAVFTRAWALHDLGRPAEAAEILDGAMADIPPEALRCSVRFGARRALAHASAGEVTHACALLADLLPKVRLIDSGTVRSDVRLLAATLRRWPRQPEVIALTPELTATLRPSGVA